MKISISVQHISTNCDLTTLAQQINEASWSTENEIGEGEYSADSLNKYLQQSGNIFLSANINGKFAGMTSATVLEKPYANSRWLYVDELDVTANSRRHGVGTAMMRYLLNMAKEKGCTELWLGTETDNTAARALYESLNPGEVEPFIGFNFSSL